MLFAILCTDKPGATALRAQLRPSHLDYLAPHRSRILFAGPFLAEDGETSTGSLIVIDCLDRAAAEAFAAEDPYARGDLFQSVEVRAWRKVLPDGP